MKPRLHKRPTGTPLIVCECTRPKPWPLFVAHSARHYEDLLDTHKTAESQCFVEVAWHVQNLRGERVNGMEGTPYNCVRGVCPQCGGKFEVRFEATPVPNEHLYLAVAWEFFGIPQPPHTEKIEMRGKKHPIRFTDAEERREKQRLYWPKQQTLAFAKEGQNLWIEGNKAILNSGTGTEFIRAELKDAPAAAVSQAASPQDALHFPSKTLVRLTLQTEMTALMNAIKDRRAGITRESCQPQTPPALSLLTMHPEFNENR